MSLKTLYWGKNYKEVEKDKHAIFSLDILTTRKYSGLSNPLHKTLLKLLSSLRSQGEWGETGFATKELKGLARQEYILEICWMTFVLD